VVGVGDMVRLMNFVDIEVLRSCLLCEQGCINAPSTLITADGSQVIGSAFMAVCRILGVPLRAYQRSDARL
jgi:hypothetical protein